MWTNSLGFPVERHGLACGICLFLRLEFLRVGTLCFVSLRHPALANLCAWDTLRRPATGQKNSRTGIRDSSVLEEVQRTYPAFKERFPRKVTKACFTLLFPRGNDQEILESLSQIYLHWGIHVALVISHSQVLKESNCLGQGLICGNAESWSGWERGGRLCWVCW